MRLNKLVPTTVFAVASLFASSTIVFAQSTNLSATATRMIDVSAGQRMLAQRIVKATCLSAAQVNFASNFQEIREAHEDFKIRHYAMLNGSSTENIPRTTSDVILGNLSTVGRVFQGFSPIVDRVTQTGNIDQIELVSLNDQSLFLVGSLNETIQQISTVYAESLSSQNLGLTLTLDIAARQTMLSQQLVKEMCLMHLLGNQSGNIQSSMDLFDASLNALIDGFPAAGVIAPPTQEIRNKLIEVKNIWTTLKPIAEKSAAGNVPDRDSLYMFSLAMEAVLRTTSEATALYTR